MEHAGAESLTGVVKFFSQKKGYGFVTLPDGSEIFVHQKEVNGNPLQTNDTVSFVRGVDNTTGRPAACGVTGGTGQFMNKGGFGGFNGGFGKGFNPGFGGGFGNPMMGGGKGFNPMMGGAPMGGGKGFNPMMGGGVPGMNAGPMGPAGMGFAGGKMGGGGKGGKGKQPMMGVPMGDMTMAHQMGMGAPMGGMGGY